MAQMEIVVHFGVRDPNIALPARRIEPRRMERRSGWRRSAAALAALMAVALGRLPVPRQAASERWRWPHARTVPQFRERLDLPCRRRGQAAEWRSKAGLRLRGNGFSGIRRLRAAFAAGRQAPVSSALGQARREISRHLFVGGNFFLLGRLNRLRHKLRVAVLPQEFKSAVLLTAGFLQ